MVYVKRCAKCALSQKEWKKETSTCLSLGVFWQKDKAEYLLIFRTRTQNIHLYCIAVYIRTTIH